MVHTKFYGMVRAANNGMCVVLKVYQQLWTNSFTETLYIWVTNEIWHKFDIILTLILT